MIGHRTWIASVLGLADENAILDHIIRKAGKLKHDRNKKVKE